MIIIPAIDIKDGKCIRLIRGEISRKISYSLEPLELAMLFEMNGAEWIHIIDIDGALKSSFQNWRLIEEIIRNVKSKIQVGGGIRAISTIEKLLEIGVERVVLSSMVFTNKSLFEEITKKFLEKFIVSIDVNKDTVMLKGWKEEGFKIDKALAYLKNSGISELIFTDIQRDGTLKGVKVEKIKRLTKTGFEIYYAGGVRNEKEIEILKNIRGVKGVIVGRAFLEGKIGLDLLKREKC